jgi:hypothetical protein
MDENQAFIEEIETFENNPEAIEAMLLDMADEYENQ